MKKIFIILSLALMSVGAFAEKGDVHVGVDARYNCDSDRQTFGVGAKAQWEFMKNFRAEAAASHMFEKDGYQTYEGEINLQYLFRIGDSGFCVYPIAGGKYRNYRDYTRFDIKDGQIVSQSEPKWSGEISVQVGGGVEYPITEKLKVNADCKYYGYDHAPEVSVGVALKL